MKTIAELNEANFDQTLTRGSPPAVVDFYAPWCGPCKMLAPLLEHLAGQFADRIRFFKVNVDEAPELAARFAITGVPTLLFFNHGEVRDAVVGLVPPRALAAKLEALAANPAEAPV
jgi:thioredoxin 1